MRVFAYGQAAYFALSAVGWVVGAAIAPYYSDPTIHMGVGIGLAFVIVIILVYVFPQERIARISAHFATGPTQGEDASETAADEVAQAPFDERSSQGEKSPTQDDDAFEPFAGYERAADPKYGLSRRELEVLVPFAQGRSANWIAESMYISKNTVRSHLRSVYTKLDVHTRQELLDFLAGFASEDKDIS